MTEQLKTLGRTAGVGLLSGFAFACGQLLVGELAHLIKTYQNADHGEVAPHLN